MATLSVKGNSQDLFWGTGGSPDPFQLYFSSLNNPADLIFTSTKVTAVEYAGMVSTFVWDIGGSFTRAADGTISGTVTSLALGDLGPTGTGAKVQLMNLTGLNTTYATLLDIAHGRVSASILMAGNDTLNGAGFVADPNFPMGVSLFGEAGNDTLTGTAYDDFLNGGTGNDTMTGGLGNDTYKVDSAQDVIIESAGQGTNDRVSSAISFNMTQSAPNVENLTLNTYLNVNGIGNGWANNISGGAGNNVLNGVGGNDNLRGFGGADILVGGTGKDTLSGGIGNDVFKFNAIGESVVGVNRDVIQDFVRGQDKINLSAIDAQSATTGVNDAFTFTAGATFTAAGQVRFANGILYGNTDGNAATAEFEIALTGVTVLAATDFVL